jgi:hypothetical protein
MLVHPYRDKVRVVNGCRMLSETLNLIGTRIRDPREPHRVWTIENLYAPLTRKIGGIRAKARDQKDFITFINQRDLEVLINHANPGDYCRWLGEEYVDPSEPDWFGFCADEDDLRDDLYDRELALRMEYGPVLPTGLEIVRRVHLSEGIDVEELWLLIADVHPERGFAPDPGFSTLLRRWARVQQERVLWKRT